jgi:hypothetical protein
MGGQYDNTRSSYDDYNDGYYYGVHRIFFLEGVEDAA